MDARKLAAGFTQVAAVAALVIVPTAIGDTPAYAAPGISGFSAPADDPPPPPPPPPPGEAPPPGPIPRCPGALSGVPRAQWPHPCRRRIVVPVVPALL
ncbi:hypothetical protein [Mycobacterium sp.]|uniref:hypothetical protein n=1 Tax=Mycobacterium sp. TaxID=1785 RepID=UPI0031E0EAB1